MAEKIRILLADDHTVVREGLHALLDREKDFEVVGQARDGHEAVELTATHAPHVAVVDLAMPALNGIEATRRIVRDYPDVKVLVLSMHVGEEYIREAMDAGANGYVAKGSAAEELVAAIRAIADGSAYFSQDIPLSLIEKIRDGVRTPNPLDRLTTREREVLQLIAEGNTNKEIAALLELSVKTVEAHRANLMAKLDIHDTATLTRFAISRGVVEPS